MTSDFWDERYSVQEYIFGTEPNQYFKQKIDSINPGKILVVAAGEGRDAVYAATKGWNVFAFDKSKVACKKALKLSKSKQAKINYKISDSAEYKIRNKEFDVIAVIYFHLPPVARKEFFSKIISGLKEGGYLIIEAFNSRQLSNKSGGPKEMDLLLTKEILENEITGLKIIENYEKEIYLKEGKGHSGKADVVRFFAKKE